MPGVLRLRSGFRLRAQTPAKRLNFDPYNAHHFLCTIARLAVTPGVLRLRSGFRLLALASLTPAKRLKFDPYSAHHSLQTPSLQITKPVFRLYKTSLQKQKSSVFTK